MSAILFVVSRRLVSLNEFVVSLFPRCQFGIKRNVTCREMWRNYLKRAHSRSDTETYRRE